RAAVTANWASTIAPSATPPSTSSVAGLTLSKLRPLCASTRRPSMSIRSSPTFARALLLLFAIPSPQSRGEERSPADKSSILASAFPALSQPACQTLRVMGLPGDGNDILTTHVDDLQLHGSSRFGAEMGVM